jgi:hypothetical protein
MARSHQRLQYEMGGTWIHWRMTHIYQEVSLYGLQNDWTVTQNPGSKEDYCTLTRGEKQRNMTHTEEEDIVGRVFKKFADVDGEDLRKTWKYVFSTGPFPQLLKELDGKSCQDRIDDISDQLTAEELSVLESFLLQMGGAPLHRMGLLDALRWWSLGSHKPTGLNDIALHTRLRSGNSELHRRIFNHALSTGNLSYQFETPVQSIEEDSSIVTITTRTGESFQARSVICTVPLNVLSSLNFSPPLGAEKLEAAAAGSVNRCDKIHMDVNDADWLSWSSLTAPGQGVISAFGDGLTPADNSHLVSFGPDPDSETGISLDDVETIKKAIIHLIPEGKRAQVIVNRIVRPRRHAP